ncbi:MAG: tRNA uridine-5-carboxymethylaminomethyl(34) synthesis GTPase MnmE [Rhizobiaceae bacterium]|nr:tRNA uridine-5-carboxymethylaminomethyl(34) synthesis GTPase MnmE [Rhizobiaceae bacterium]
MISSSSGDSIVALSSGRLPAGVAVIRLSGPHTRFVVETVFGTVPTPRQAAYGAFRDTRRETIDSGLLLFFPGPRSFTGEDCAEFHVHGGKAVAAALLREVTSVPGVRHAEAGEFTRRAFLNGKLDLPETEALADLLLAETEAQRRQAVLNASGAQSELYASWRRRLINARAMIEAELDFADEADVPGSVADTIWADVESLANEMRAHVSAYHRAEMIRDGYDVVIAGAPNAGKSSLLNALARRDAAIVSDEPGTTRDLVEVSLDLSGVKVRITDTAGIRDAAGKVEAMGIERSLRRAGEADLVLLLEHGASHAPRIAEIGGENIIRIASKADLVTGEADADLAVSSLTGEGLSELIELIANRAVEAVGNIGDILPSRLRHIDLLQQTQRCLVKALGDGLLELRAEELRQATGYLGRLTGEIDVEDLLDVIFSQFCIGK